MKVYNFAPPRASDLLFTLGFFGQMMGMTYMMLFLKGCLNYWIAMYISSPSSYQILNDGTQKKVVIRKRKHMCSSFNRPEKKKKKSLD